jgi:transcriptional regulator with XRE-family HTH domain
MKKERKAKEKMYGNRIKEFLTQKQMYLQELSDITEISLSHLSRIVNGQRRCISLPIAIKISQALKEPVEMVFMYQAPVQRAEIDDDLN